MRIALYQPDIPQNTGTILRLAACVEVPVELIGPAGFDMSDRALKRAGMDYLTMARVTRHVSWARFWAWKCESAPQSRLVAATVQGSVRHVDFAFRRDDILIMGRESAGLPEDVHAIADARVRVPMAPGRRSLNVAVASAMMLGEALRQTDGWPD